MDPQILIGITVGIITILGAVVAVARFFAKNQQQLDLLKQEIRSLYDQNTSIKTSANLYTSEVSSGAFRGMTDVSGEAAKAVKADVHSISVPASPESPTHLRIIYSTDVQRSQIQGMEYPIEESNAGWVFTHQQPYRRVGPQSDKPHYKLVDEAAGTRTGEGFMMTLPLVAGNRCYGVIQFFRQTKPFDDEDQSTAFRYVPSITKRVIDIQESPREDIPTVAHGHSVRGSVLFTDIQNFSEIAKNTNIAVTVTLLNEYYGRLLPFALEKRGILQEYVGDGLYISFVLDSPNASARAALEVALEMQAEFDKMLQKWRKFQLPVSSKNTHCIGIASGPIYQGLMGYEKERREKLVGSAINLASHLCEAGIDFEGGVLIDRETYNLVKTENFDVKSIEPKRKDIGECFQVLGRTQPTYG